MMITELIAALGLGSNACNILSGLKMGKDVEKIVSYLKDISYTFEKINDSIYYSDQLKVIKSFQEERKIVNNVDDQYFDSLRTLQKISGQKLLASAFIETPQVMKNMLRSSPEDSLFSISPLNSPLYLEEPSLIPISFFKGEKNLVGWQKKGILPFIYDFEYNKNLWLPKLEMVKDETLLTDFNKIINDTSNEELLSDIHLPKLIRDQLSLEEKRRKTTWELYYKEKVLEIEGECHRYYPDKLFLIVNLETGKRILIEALFSKPLSYDYYSRLNLGRKCRVLGKIQSFTSTSFIKKFLSETLNEPRISISLIDTKLITIQ